MVKKETSLTDRERQLLLSFFVRGYRAEESPALPASVRAECVEIAERLAAIYFAEDEDEEPRWRASPVVSYLDRALSAQDNAKADAAPGANAKPDRRSAIPPGWRKIDSMPSGVDCRIMSATGKVAIARRGKKPAIPTKGKRPRRLLCYRMDLRRGADGQFLMGGDIYAVAWKPDDRKERST